MPKPFLLMPLISIHVCNEASQSQTLETTWSSPARGDRQWQTPFPSPLFPWLANATICSSSEDVRRLPPAPITEPPATISLFIRDHTAGWLVAIRLANSYTTTQWQWPNGTITVALFINQYKVNSIANLYFLLILVN